MTRALDDNFRSGGTGEPIPSTCSQRVIPFNQYEVVTAVAPDGKLLGIVEIRVRKDFLTAEQVRQRPRSLDVDQFYQD